MFSYRSVKPQYMIGYQVIENRPGIKFKIAGLVYRYHQSKLMGNLPLVDILASLKFINL